MTEGNGVMMSDKQNDDEIDIEAEPRTDQEDTEQAPEASQQEHNNPETQEDTASGGAPE